MMKFINIAVIIFTLLFIGCTNKESSTPNAITCLAHQKDVFGVILGAIHDGDYKKFSEYIPCLENVNLKDENGITLLMYASGFLEFISSAPDIQKFKVGLKNNLNDPYVFVSDLLKMGANPNLTGMQGHTALLTVIYHGRIASAWLILRNGGDPNLAEENGFTPIMMAAHHCNDDSYELLKAFGANETATNQSGMSAQSLYKKCQQ